MKERKKAKSDGRGAQDDLVGVLARYRITLRASGSADWRVTYGKNGERLLGELPGIVVGSVTCLCTDGLLAWFLLGDGETLLFGHWDNFAEAKKEPGERRAPKRAKKSDANIALAMDMLGLG